MNKLVTDLIARSPRARRSTQRCAAAGFVTLMCVPNVRRFGEILKQLMRKMAVQKGLTHHGGTYKNESLGPMWAT